MTWLLLFLAFVLVSDAVFTFVDWVVLNGGPLVKVSRTVRYWLWTGIVGVELATAVLIFREVF